MIDPDLTRELALVADGHGLVGGCDEVGRGALAGPVTVGIVVVAAECAAPPQGIRDSKALSARRREALVDPIRDWARAAAVGHAQAAEIDDLGIVAALRVAGLRALAALGCRPDVVILDGPHDWLGAPAVLGEPADLPQAPPVVAVPGADASCTSVAAASILAKVARDALMSAWDGEIPGFDWAANKGYAAPHHLAALRARGPSEQHRRSWRLPG